jgi:mRNA-degrading endonuclease toxin of MazEF toxin-antitoxin module
MIAGRSCTMYQRGDVVLIPFPFSDLSSSKTRPTVVVNVEEYERETGNLTVAIEMAECRIPRGGCRN